MCVKCFKCFKYVKFVKCVKCDKCYKCFKCFKCVKCVKCFNYVKCFKCVNYVKFFKCIKQIQMIFILTAVTRNLHNKFQINCGYLLFEPKLSRYRSLASHSWAIGNISTLNIHPLHNTYLTLKMFWITPTSFTRHTCSSDVLNNFQNNCGYLLCEPKLSRSRYFRYIKE